MIVRPSTPQDETQIIDVLARAFSADRSAPFLNPALLRWKYWEPCDDWPEPRSWVAEQDDRIVAHNVIWPVTVRTGQSTESGITTLDWAADQGGVLLMRRMKKMYPFSYCIGGTPMTQSLLPRLGYEVVAEALTWARPLRPLRKILRYQRGDLRSPLKVARKVRWSMSHTRKAVPRWVAIKAGSGSADDTPVPLLERGEGFIRYLERCPVARFLTFHIVSDGRKVGWFCLAEGRVQARVAGIWLEHSTSENWRIAFCLARRAALDHTDAYEIVARCATADSCSGAEQAGMRVRKRVPVFFSRQNGGSQLPPLQFQLCDDDAVFLNIDTLKFLT